MRVGIVGRGRMARALAPALAAAGHEVSPLAGRGADGRDAEGAPYDAVLLAVPDGAIAEAASHICDGPLIGHLSGATPLAAFGGRAGVFSVHPLLSVTGPETAFEGAWAAIDSDGDAAGAAAEGLVRALGLRPFTVADPDRAAYHAAASIASNFLVTVEGAAEDLGRTAGVPREALLALARGALENWGRLGAAEALTGPVARGDADTVARQRGAVAERLPGELATFDALVAATARLARRSGSGSGLPAADPDADPAPGIDTGESV